MNIVRPKRRKYHIIYKTTCLVTGKWYIGLHSTDDLNDGYQGSGSMLWKSIKKHGKDQHRTEILEHCPDRATLIRREAEIVTADLLEQEACLNLMLGGSAGPEFKKPTAEETLALISQRSKEMWQRLRADPERMAARSAKLADPKLTEQRAKANTGKKRSAAQRDNIRAGQQRYQAEVDPVTLKERAQKAAQTKMERGTNRGGRPKGIPMSDAEKLKLGLRMKESSPLARRAVCAGCGKETTAVALNRYHAQCIT